MPARFYKLVKTSQRGYLLLPEQIELNVNSLVRIPNPIVFEPVKVRKAPAAPTKSSARLKAKATPSPPPPVASKREKLNFLGELKHNEILT